MKLPTPPMSTTTNSNILKHTIDSNTNKNKKEQENKDKFSSNKTLHYDNNETGDKCRLEQGAIFIDYQMKKRFKCILV